MVDYPSNPPASLPNYPSNAPIPPGTTVSGTSGGSGGYYQGLQAAAAMNQPASSSSASAPIAAAPAAAPAGTSAYAAAPAPHGGFDEEFGAAVAAGAVPWSGLPTEVQADLHKALGAQAPHAYEQARVATAKMPVNSGVLGADRGAPSSRSFFDPVQESGGIGTGTLATDVSKGLGKILAGPGPDRPTPVTGPPGQMFNQGFNGPQSPVAAAPPPIVERGDGENVAKNVFDTNIGAVRGNTDAATASRNPDFGFAVGNPAAPVPAAAVPPSSNNLPVLNPLPPRPGEVTTMTPTASPNVPGGGAPPAPASPGLPAPPPGMPLPQPRPPMNDLGSGTAPAEKTHIMLPGDTLWDIARTELGDPNRAMQIAAMNGIPASGVRSIRPGTPLKLPTAAADMPTPRERPTITAPPGRASNLDDGSYYGGLAKAAGPPFAGGADAQATSGPRDMAAMPSQATETAPVTLPEGQAKWAQDDQDYDRTISTEGMQPNRDEGRLYPYPDKYYDQGYRPFEQMNPNNRYMEDLVPGYKQSEYDVSALSANDNGPKGQSYIPGSRLPPAMQPNMMPDYFRDMKPLPVSKPANQADDRPMGKTRIGSNLLKTGDGEFDVAIMSDNENRSGLRSMTPNVKSFSTPAWQKQYFLQSHVPYKILNLNPINPANTNIGPGGSGGPMDIFFR